MKFLRNVQLPSGFEIDGQKNKQNKIKKVQKPWSKKERFLVLGTLILTVAPAMFLAFSARSWKVGGLPVLKFPKFSLEETFIIEGDTSTSELESKLAEITHAYSGVYGVYVYESKSDFRWGLNKTRKFQAASLIKLPVMLTLYTHAENGDFDLDTIYSLKEEDKLGGAGSLRTKPAGTKYSYRELARYMGKESDNTAFNIIKKQLGPSAINKFIEGVGMKNTSLEENVTTPQDIGILLHKLYRGELVSPKSRDEILSFLTNTNFEDWLVNGVPEGVPVAHKFGRETHVINDAGIVFAPSPYVVVLMSDGIIESEADEALVKLSRFIYESLSQD